jgi:hypothetical protein
MTSPSRRHGIALAVGLALLAARAHAAAPKELEPLSFLIGSWTAGGGKSGAPTGGTTFARSLQDRVILRTNYSDNPATEKGPASRHDDLMVIHAADGGSLRAEYFDNEGHVIHYVVTSAGPGEATFLSDAVPNAPRFRLSYHLAAGGVLKGEFAIAPPGSADAFSPYLSWEARASDAGGKAGP